MPANEFADFLRQFPQLSSVANVEVMDYLNIPSPYMTPQMMFELAKLIDLKIIDFDGVVVTHGTGHFRRNRLSMRSGPYHSETSGFYSSHALWQ